MDREREKEFGYLLMVGRVVMLKKGVGQQVIRITFMKSVNLSAADLKLTDEIGDFIDEGFRRWVTGRLRSSRNVSSANIRIYRVSSGLRVVVMASRYGAMIDNDGYIAATAEAAWLVRDELRRRWPHQEAKVEHQTEQL